MLKRQRRRGESIVNMANGNSRNSSLLGAVLTRLSARIAPLVRAELVAASAAELKRQFNFKDQLLPELRQRVEAIAAGELPERVEAILARELPAQVEAILARDLSGQVEVIVARELAWRLEAVLVGELPARAEAIVAREVPERVEAILAKQPLNPITGYQLYQPNRIATVSAAGEYMAASNALARDFLHTEYREFCRLCGNYFPHNHPFTMHRKLWEWAFIYERLHKAGVLRRGTQGLGFGVGDEKLPSLFASLGARIMATDAPVGGHWQAFGQYAGSKQQLFYADTISQELFDDRVSFEFCNMNDIPAHLTDYDFCWSSCAFEHLGTLQRGIDFVINSIERTLKVGGIACHTTELNLSSNDETIETGVDVIYRKKDLEQLCRILEERGHWVEPLRIEPGTLPPDYLVDLPPYHADPHLKLLLGGYVTTSVGLVARRGR
jgi:hypothetical protein